jgi:hypothetical protein
MSAMVTLKQRFSQNVQHCSQDGVYLSLSFTINNKQFIIVFYFIQERKFLQPKNKSSSRALFQESEHNQVTAAKRISAWEEPFTLAAVFVSMKPKAGKKGINGRKGSGIKIHKHKVNKEDKIASKHRKNDHKVLCVITRVNLLEG